MNSALGKQLLKLIESNDLEAVDTFLKENENLNIDERDQDGQSFLMIASRLSHVEIVRRLLEDFSAEDVNAVDNDDWSSLLNASKEGSAEIVKMLLDAGANIEHRDMAGWTALMWACYKGWTNVVDVLLERNANPNVKGEHHMSCLTWAAGRGHSGVVNSLLRYGAKVNTADKYGTTPLIWAARKGHHDIVYQLLNKGAVVDKAGMNSWTALIVACKGGYTSVVKLILDHHPNINAVDKDGFTPLGMAAKEGFVEIVNMLLQKGAYGNLTDREGDSILIHAVKNNNIEVVKLLLKKYADVDTQGVDNKTALHWAVEKGHLTLAKLLLEHNANMELTNKDGDTVLLRAVRSRNLEMVQLLVEKGAKISANDKRGDNSLHIAVRSKSKRITEQLLRNPKYSKLLYHKNKKGETAYEIDASHDRSILTQVFGAKNLNADDNLQGYDLYSATIADVLSEPSLRTPITVGLFARWGSGKSSLIKRLREEMEAYTDLTGVEKFTFSFVHVLASLVFFGLVGFAFGIPLPWYVGVAVGVSLFLLQMSFYGLVWYGSSKRGWSRAINVGCYLAKQTQFMVLLMKLIFCNVPEQRNRDTSSIRFIFTDNARLNTIMGEKTIISIIGTLCDALESKYGIISTRLYKIFKPKKVADHGKFKSLCCIPYFIVVILLIIITIVACCLLYAFGFDKDFSKEAILTNSFILVLFIIPGVFVVGNCYTWYKVFISLVVPTRRQIQRISSKAVSEVNKLDSIIPMLKKEVDMIGWMVRTMDAFTENHTRMVVVVDGLDSCEQDKLLNVLDLVHILFGDTNSPFVTILAVDPHVIIKGIEHNINSQFRDTGINGHDYLRNIVQLPFFIQSQCLPKPFYRNFTKLDLGQPSGDAHGVTLNCHRQESQISGASYLSLTDVGKSKGRRRKLSTGNPLSNSTTLIRQPSIYDLSKSLGKASYFSDVNPRNMKRLMNILAVTGRLLRAFSIEFNWYKLASWINLTEQWPYRLSWIILEVEDHDNIEDSQSIKNVYDRVSVKIPSSRDVDPLLEIDRNVRKLEVFLASSSPPLTVADMRRFLPCTINIDPYLRKLIRELQQNAENMSNEMYGTNHSFDHQTRSGAWPRAQLRRRNHSGSPGQSTLPYSIGPSIYPPAFPHGVYLPPLFANQYEPSLPTLPSHPVALKGAFPRKPLSSMSVEEVCNLVERIEGTSEHMVEDYINQLRSNNISGLVLANCDINELKSVLKMKFGDWELFRCLVETLKNDSGVSLSPTEVLPSTSNPISLDVRKSSRESHFSVREPSSPARRKHLTSIPGSVESEKSFKVHLSDTSKTIGQSGTVVSNHVVVKDDRDSEVQKLLKSKTETHPLQQQHQQSAPGGGGVILMRQDSFVNEVIMETEALINIVEATGVESESDTSSEGQCEGGNDVPRSGISPIPEEECSPINHPSTHSSFISLNKHPVLSRQPSQESSNVGDRVFFVGPDNDSGESDSEEVERLSHKSTYARKQAQKTAFPAEKSEHGVKRVKLKGETTTMRMSTDSTVPLLDLHVSPLEEVICSVDHLQHMPSERSAFTPGRSGVTFVPRTSEVTFTTSQISANVQQYRTDDYSNVEFRTPFDANVDPGTVGDHRV